MSQNENEYAEKENEIVIKQQDGKHEISFSMKDYRAIITIILIAVSALLAATGNEAWKEFVILAGAAIGFWFARARVDGR